MNKKYSINRNEVDLSLLEKRDDIKLAIDILSPSIAFPEEFSGTFAFQKPKPQQTRSWTEEALWVGDIYVETLDVYVNGDDAWVAITDDNNYCHLSKAVRKDNIIIFNVDDGWDAVVCIVDNDTIRGIDINIFHYPVAKEFGPDIPFKPKTWDCHRIGCTQIPAMIIAGLRKQVRELSNQKGASKVEIQSTEQSEMAPVKQCQNSNLDDAPQYLDHLTQAFNSMAYRIIFKPNPKYDNNAKTDPFGFPETYYIGLSDMSARRYSIRHMEGDDFCENTDKIVATYQSMKELLLDGWQPD